MATRDLTPAPAEVTGVHRFALMGAFGMVLFTLVAVIASVIADGGRIEKTVGSPALERDLFFRDAKGGVVVVFDGSTRERLGEFAPGEGAFVRSAMRALTQKRRERAIPLTEPYTLILAEDGHLSITDPLTGQFIKLNGFGSVATRSFGRFLPASAREAQSPKVSSMSEKGA